MRPQCVPNLVQNWLDLRSMTSFWYNFVHSSGYLPFIFSRICSFAYVFQFLFSYFFSGHISGSIYGVVDIRIFKGLVGLCSESREETHLSRKIFISHSAVQGSFKNKMVKNLDFFRLFEAFG